MLTILVVSDATGETAERLINSALVQFADARVNVQRRGQVRDPEGVRAVVAEAAAHRALILHTLVSNQLRHVMLEESRRLGIDAMDLMGPLLDRLAMHLDLTPMEKPGLFLQLVEARSRAIEAVEFAFRHDDGQHVDELNKAEIVLVGVSRTMKTPITLYLAYRGWFAANVPLVIEVPPPAELLALPPSRVFCLHISPVRLLEWRKARAEAFNIPVVPYASMPSIRQELQSARQLCLDQGWQPIDVTGKSVEEIAREILSLRAATEPERAPAW